MMHIVFECDRALPVQKYGGTERIIFWLMKALVAQGHQVSFIGPKESQVESIGARLIQKNPDQDWHTLIPQDTSIVHLFSTPSIPLSCPFLVTIEGNGQVGETFHPNTVFISKKHAENHGSSIYVYNGIDFDEYPFPPHPKLQWNRFGFLAKGSWKVKNLHHCIQAAKASGVTLEICGGRHWGFSSKIISHGMVDQKKKLEVLSRIDALLFPVRWHEPFGIAIVESFALGRPVIGSPYGSLPELISQNRGLICQNYSELVEVLKNPPKRFNPLEIRKEAEEAFSSIQMAKNYLKLYERVIQGETLHRESPKAQFKTSAETLLPF